ncbi:MAG: ABC transporter permease subunit [Fusobacteriaceae bacterium]|jgi:NitT/TauT family transport system permease protein|nr:ABC transporter permease subunit [Fusobacteriaceae bacterium]
MKKFLSLSKYVIIVVLWQILAIYIDNQLFFPRIQNVILSIKDIIRNDNFFFIIFNTLLYLLTSFILSGILSIIMAALAHKFKLFCDMLNLLFSIINSLPSLIIIILVIIWSDIKFVPLAVSITIVVPIFYSNILSGINSISNDIVDICKVYKISNFNIIKKIYIPGIFFYIAPTLGTIISINLKIILASEILSQKSNTIGGEIFINKIYLNTSNIFAWIIIVFLINICISKIIKIINIKFKKER